MQPMDLVVHIYWTASKELRLLEFLFIPKLTENIFNNVIDICYFSSYNFFNFWNIDDKLQWYILYIFTFLLHVLFKIPWRNITCNYYKNKNFIKKILHSLSVELQNPKFWYIKYLKRRIVVQLNKCWKILKYTSYHKIGEICNIFFI